ncbi:hypothetical protein BLNAU_18180 [Blattamonas nauphoetae]|uniref:Uncharacterized protein n=1 Tax=Blattamonas nauphoetae TaxID=2049346 RepID=A0ABQ9X527_9EUKA|nr:hypothetical protein BLNAU_18180 [Blattamonas nauphoetae]
MWKRIKKNELNGRSACRPRDLRLDGSADLRLDFFRSESRLTRSGGVNISPDQNWKMVQGIRCGCDVFPLLLGFEHNVDVGHGEGQGRREGACHSQHELWVVRLGNVEELGEEIRAEEAFSLCKRKGDTNCSGSQERSSIGIERNGRVECVRVSRTSAQESFVIGQSQFRSRER